MRDAATQAGGTVSIDWKLEYEGFEVAADSDAVTLVADACRSVGLDPKTMVTGGGSDANVIAALGSPVLALSCGMQGVHGTSEQIAVTDLEQLATLCVTVAAHLDDRAGT
jgi:tripeptide aminopeptidase